MKSNSANQPVWNRAGLLPALNTVSKMKNVESPSSRPHHFRQVQTPAVVVERILKLRVQYPRRGKDKLVVLS